MAIYGGQGQQRWGDNTARTNTFIRDIQLTDQTGRTCHTGQVRGKGALVLSFIDATSPNANRILALLEQLATGYKDSGKVTVWPIFSAGTSAEVDAVVKAAGFTGSRLIDADGYHAQLYGIADYPTTLLINAPGTIVAKTRRFGTESLQAISTAIATIIDAETPVTLA
jgi:peroxiredoxin